MEGDKGGNKEKGGSFTNRRVRRGRRDQSSRASKNHKKESVGGK